MFQQGFSDIEKSTLHSSEDYAAMLDEALAGYGHYRFVARGCGAGAVIQAFNEYQLLCALQKVRLALVV